MTTASALLAALAVAIAMTPGGRGADRLAAAVVPAGSPRPATTRSWTGFTVAVVAALLGGPQGAFLVLLAAFLRRLWLRGAADRVASAQAARVRREAPLAYDLLAVCIEAGIALPVAARIVASAVGGPVERPLSRMAAALESGAAVVEAAAGLAACGLGDAADTLAAAESGGPGLSAALHALAAEHRRADAAAARAAAKRSGVWAVGPLTLCFLPAFVLVGVVPIVGSVLRDALP
ncbi:MAG: putative type secretion system protein [Frankiales bacterium]|nr:putative type secretion system protein [Frankiales bacterium]